MATTLTPVTQERIEAQLDAFNLKHFRSEEGLTHTAFPGLVVYFQVADFGFKASARWMATARTETDTRALRVKANEFNRAMPLVRTHPITRDDNTTVIIIEAPFLSNTGVTDEQLQAMLEFYFSAIHHIAGQLHEAFPQIEDAAATQPGSEA